MKILTYNTWILTTIVQWVHLHVFGSGRWTLVVGGCTLAQVTQQSWRSPPEPYFAADLTSSMTWSYSVQGNKTLICNHQYATLTYRCLFRICLHCEMLRPAFRMPVHYTTNKRKESNWYQDGPTPWLIPTAHGIVHHKIETRWRDLWRSADFRHVWLLHIWRSNNQHSTLRACNVIILRWVIKHIRTILEYILAWQIWSIELAASPVFVLVVARITRNHIIITISNILKITTSSLTKTRMVLNLWSWLRKQRNKCSHQVR